MKQEKIVFKKVHEINKDGWYLIDDDGLKKWRNPKMAELYILDKYD